VDVWWFCGEISGNVVCGSTVFPKLAQDVITDFPAQIQLVSQFSELSSLVLPSLCFFWLGCVFRVGGCSTAGMFRSLCDIGIDTRLCGAENEKLISDRRCAGWIRGHGGIETTVLMQLVVKD
jgi:hypothetical protein